MTLPPRRPPVAHSRAVQPRRRDILAALGAGTASVLATSLACGSAQAPTATGPVRRAGEVRAWLREAVARLVEVHASVHALAVHRRWTCAAIDDLGPTIGHEERGAVVLSVVDRQGVHRERVASALDADAIRDAVAALGGRARGAAVAFPPPPSTDAPLDPVAPSAVLARVEQLGRAERVRSSRITYAAAAVEVEDATVWSIASDHDREHSTRRTREHAVRAAWIGARPIVREVSRGFVGVGERLGLTAEDIERTSARALQHVTPGAPPRGPATVVLEPEVAAAIVGVLVDALTASPGRAPRRRPPGTAIGPSTLTIVDAPGTAGAYGAFAFDDTGELARRAVLVDAGKVASPLPRARRPGHVGARAALPSHLIVEPGAPVTGAGWVLEGAVDVAYDPGGDRVTVGVAHARELSGDHLTGRVYRGLEVTARLDELVASLAASTSIAERFATRSLVAGEPCWRSIETPALRASAELRPREELA